MRQKPRPICYAPRQAAHVYEIEGIGRKVPGLRDVVDDESGVGREPVVTSLKPGILIAWI